jgi:hypothetical protein
VVISHTGVESIRPEPGNPRTTIVKRIPNAIPLGVKHFCLGWDVGILHDWWQANGRSMRDRLGTEET